MTNPSSPRIVQKEEWQQELAALLKEEKELTRLGDKIAAKRRQLPMYEVRSDYKFETESGTKTLLELFEGRDQLIVYHFMFAPEWEKGCSGCSWVTDAMSHPAHLHGRGISMVIVGRAPLEKLLKYKQSMGWGHKWASSFGSDFNRDTGATKDSGEDHGVSVFFRKGEKVYRTYFTGDRGVEHLGSHWTYLDLTPYGRKEKREGWTGEEPSTCRHNEYADS